jgi:peptidoglycan/LPS O-acetylase OafA/YrhL
MTMLSIWPTFAIIIVVVFALRINFLFSFIDLAPVAHQHRSTSLDGLRGLLASGVVFHHLLWTNYNLHGLPGMTPSRFYAFIGPSAVCVFFTITAYLFWGQILDKKDTIKWKEFYLNRVFRIAPLYLFLITLYFSFVIYKVGNPLGQSISSIASQSLKWAAFGAVENPEPFLNRPEFTSITGPTWSLHYEWLFYISMPILAVIARGRATLPILCAALVFLLFESNLIALPNRAFIQCFLIGMLSATAIRTYPCIKGDGATRSVLAILAGTGALAISADPYADRRIMLLGVFFFLVVSGTSLFQILLTRGARRLGNISYSIYLMHGLVITILLQFREFRENIIYSPVRGWFVIFFTYMLCIIVSIATYYFIELKGIALGKKAIKMMHKRVLTHEPVPGN